MLAGVRIDDARGLAGHSDADVVAHAVTDAILGALALGDLGARFGVDRPETEGVASLDLLAEVVADVRERGWRVGNIDVTVVAQQPRLSAHREAMVANLARVLDAAPTHVSVKATTTDRLGAIGRAEGVAAWAVCLLVAVEDRGASTL